MSKNLLIFRISTVYQRLPSLLTRYDAAFSEYDEDGFSSATETAGNENRRKRMRSVLYQFNPVNLRLSPIDLPMKMRIKFVAISDTHRIVLSSERLVYTWGENAHGQLGLDDREPRPFPCLVEYLTGKSINKIACGNGFSAFCSDNGIVMTGGKASLIGQGPIDGDLLKPRLIDPLLSMDMLTVACGAEHTVVVGEGGKVFAWGSGANGRLGTGNEEHCFEPCQIEIPKSLLVRDVRCGPDCTMFLTDAGLLLACGNNAYNKLSLNQRQSLLAQIKLSKPEIENAFEPTTAKNIVGRAVDACLGPKHTVVLLDSGHVLTFGCNSNGELGRGHTKSQVQGAVLVKQLADKTVLAVQCGHGFTIAGTADHTVYFWGSRQNWMNSTGSTTLSNSFEHRSTKLETIASCSNIAEMQDEAPMHPNVPEIPSTDLNTFISLKDPSTESNDSNRPLFEASQGPLATSNKPPASASTARWPFSRWRSAGAQSRIEDLNSSQSEDMSHLVLNPTQVLRLVSSGTHILPTSVVLGSLLAHGDEVYIVVDTTAPLPKWRQRRKKAKTKGTLIRKLKDGSEPGHQQRQIFVPTEAALKSGAESHSEIDTEHETKALPTWLRNELEQNEILQFETRLHPNPKLAAKQLQPSESSSTSTDEKRKLQKRTPKPHHPPKKAKQPAAELERIQKEKLEAENRLKNLEEDYQKQQQQQIRAKEREQQLEEEIARLRNALVQQNGQVNEPMNEAQQQVPYTNGNVPNEKNAQQFQAIPVPKRTTKSKFCVIL